MLCVNVAMAMIDEKTSEHYIIEVKKGERILDFRNKPFVENDTIYFPLRETFEKFGIMENKNSYIDWDNSKIDICIAWSDNSDYAKEAHSQFNNGNGVDVITLLHYYRIEIGKSELIENATKNLAGLDMSKPRTMNNAPILKNGVTYVPYEYIKYFDVQHHFAELNFTIRNKDLTELYSVPYLSKKSVTFDTDKNRTISKTTDDEAHKIVQNYSIEQQMCYEIVRNCFYELQNGNIENMKQYCTENFINIAFSDRKFMGYTKGTVWSIKTISLYADADYTVIGSFYPDNDFTDESNSKIISAKLKRQNDNTFLIDNIRII